MSATKAATPILTPDEAAAAYIAGTPMEFNAKRNRVENGGSGDGWADVTTMFCSFWENFASGNFDFRLKPEHVYKRGDIVRVRKVRKGEGRQHEAFFEIVQEPFGRDAEGDFCLVDGEGDYQVTNRSDFEPVNIE